MEASYKRPQYAILQVTAIIQILLYHIGANL